MNKRVTIAAVALLVATLGAAAQNQVDKQGRRQGHWVRTDKDGSKIFEGDFVDGQESGTFTYYYHDGTVRIRNTYTEPGRVCTHEAYDEQGHLLARGTYNRRNRDGHWTFYAEDGRVVKEANYAMGVKEGVHVVYEHNGDTAEVSTWHNNRRHGRWWKRVGHKGFITGTYVDGGLEGLLTERDDNGALVRESKYSGGLKHGATRYYAPNGVLTVDERWNHGLLIDRRVRMLTPTEEYISVHDIACLAPQGKHKVVVYLKDGTRKVAQESADDIYDRLGNDFFAYANRKSRVLVAMQCVQGLGKDAEGREVLLIDPQPDFAIFPDDDCKKMVNSRLLDQNSPLDQYRDR